MTNDELRSAINVAKSLQATYNYDGICSEDIALQTLITLAERVIELGESCPKEMQRKKGKEIYLYYADGYNHARADMLLWVAGKLGGLEELISQFDRYSITEKQEAKLKEGFSFENQLADSIRQLFGVKEEDR